MLGAVPEPVWGYLGYAFGYKKPTSQLARVKDSRESEENTEDHSSMHLLDHLERRNGCFENI